MSSPKNVSGIYVPPHMRKQRKNVNQGQLSERKQISKESTQRSGRKVIKRTYVGITYVNDIGDVHLHIKSKVNPKSDSKKIIETANIRIATTISCEKNILLDIIKGNHMQRFNSSEEYINRWMCVNGLTYRRLVSQLCLSDEDMFKSDKKAWEKNTTYKFKDDDCGFSAIKDDVNVHELPSKIELTNYHFMDDMLIKLCRLYTNNETLSNKEKEYMDEHLPLSKYYVLPGYYNKHKTDSYDYQLMVTGSLKIINNFGICVEPLLECVRREIKEETGLNRDAYILSKFNKYGNNTNITYFKDRYGSNHFYTPCFHAEIKL
jgi:hypothetical protein